MNKLQLILIIVCLASCTVYPEGQLVITKKYSGRVKDYEYVGKYTKVLTDRSIIYVCGHIDIPDSVHCYIRTTPVYCDVHPDIRAHLESKYFSWNGQEYRVKTW